MEQKRQLVLKQNWFEPKQEKVTAKSYTPVPDLTIYPVREGIGGKYR